MPRKLSRDSKNPHVVMNDITHFFELQYIAEHAGAVGMLCWPRLRKYLRARESVRSALFVNPKGGKRHSVRPYDRSDGRTYGRFRIGIRLGDSE